MFYFNLSYWDIEEWLFASEAICRILELKSQPDYRVLQRACQQLHVCDLGQIKTPCCGHI